MFFSNTSRRLAQIDEKLFHIISTLDIILKTQANSIKQGASLMTQIDDLQAGVAENTDAVSSAVTLMSNLSSQLQSALNSGDPTKVQAVIDQLKSNSQTLAQAVVANTPAAPPTP